MTNPDRTASGPDDRQGMGQGKGREGRVRTSDARIASERNREPSPHPHAPAPGAHAADHLVNADATPGSGALPAGTHGAGQDVDGGAG